MKHLITLAFSFLFLIVNLSSQSQLEVEAPSSEVIKIKSTTGVTTTITLENDGDLPAGGAVNNRRGYLETRANDVIVGASSNNTGGDIILKLPATSSGRIMLANNTTNHIVMRSNGDLGIGTDTPSTKLDVDGQARIRNLPAAGATDSYVTADADGNLRKKSSSTPTYAIGDFAQGGVVFWLSPDGRHGKVMSVFDVHVGLWSNLGTNFGFVSLSAAHGAGNTVRIIMLPNHTHSAALACANLAYGGYDDWYLPALNEWTQAHAHKTIIDATSLTNGGEALNNLNYWTSNEQFISTNAVAIKISDGSLVFDSKTLGQNYVRAIRAFSLD